MAYYLQSANGMVRTLVKDAWDSLDKALFWFSRGNHHSLHLSQISDKGCGDKVMCGTITLTTLGVSISGQSRSYTPQLGLHRPNNLTCDFTLIKRNFFYTTGEKRACLSPAGE